MYVLLFFSFHLPFILKLRDYNAFLKLCLWVGCITYERYFRIKTGCSKWVLRTVVEGNEGQPVLTELESIRKTEGIVWGAMDE